MDATATNGLMEEKTLLSNCKTIVMEPEKKNLKQEMKKSNKNTNKKRDQNILLLHCVAVKSLQYGL